MGSDPNVEGVTGAANADECKLPGTRGEALLVKAVQERMHCSPAQARLSVDAVLSAVRELPKPLRLQGFGVFENDGKRLTLRGFKGGQG